MTTHILNADSSSSSVVGSEAPMPGNRGNRYAVAGGLLQIALAASLFFLPVYATCMPQGAGMICNRQTYLQQGGNVLGVTFLSLMIVAGILGVISTRIESVTQAGRLRSIAVLLAVSFAIVSAWSIGLIFVPGALLLLLSALFSR